MGEPLQRLFEAVRKACSTTLWSRGVDLSRAGKVSGDRADAEEVVLRVAERGGLTSRAVTFYLDDDDWECECMPHERGCEQSLPAGRGSQLGLGSQHLRRGTRAVAPQEACFDGDGQIGRRVTAELLVQQTVERRVGVVRDVREFLR